MPLDHGGQSGSIANSIRDRQREKIGHGSIFRVPASAFGRSSNHSGAIGNAAAYHFKPGSPQRVLRPADLSTATDVREIDARSRDLDQRPSGPGTGMGACPTRRT